MKNTSKVKSAKNIFRAIGRAMGADSFCLGRSLHRLRVANQSSLSRLILAEQMKRNTEIVVTSEEMKAFILAQPDDKPIDMQQSRTSDSQFVCGCVMVQYAFAMGLKNVSCGGKNICDTTHSSKSVALLDFSMGGLIQDGFCNTSKNFSDLKKSLL